MGDCERSFFLGTHKLAFSLPYLSSASASMEDYVPFYEVADFDPSETLSHKSHTEICSLPLVSWAIVLSLQLQDLQIEYT